MNVSLHEPGYPGLAEAEAARRLLRDGPNALPGTRMAGWLRLLRGIVTEPMFLMLLIAAALYAALGDRGEAVLLLCSVAIVMLITTAQEFRAQGALRALRELAAPVAHVVRDGREMVIPAADVVLGDTLVLREGDRVAADGSLLSGLVLLDESLLTGESVPVRRDVSERGDVRAGTLVVAGHGRVEVTAIGTATALGAIGDSLAASEAVPSTLQKKAARAIRIMAAIAMGFAALVGLLGWGVDGLAPLDAALGGIAVAMAIIPEEVPVVLTVFYALGARRIAREGVLARRLAAVETMGAISVLAVDKTGTLTENRMKLARLVDAEGRVHGADGALGGDAVRVLAAAREATPTTSLDPTDAALRDVEREPGAGPDRDGMVTALREFPLGDGRMFVSRVIADAEGSWHIATKGALEALLPLCAADNEAGEKATAAAMRLAGEGYRVLAVGRSRPRKGPLPTDPSAIPHELVGMVALADPVRADVPAAVAECRAAGIRVLMLTGDHPATASSVASLAGLRGTNVLTGAEIALLDDAALDERLRDVDACARVQPAEKLRLVRSLQRQGHVVAMTGDGVNDAPALRAADVGVAMGERGSEVARETADLILLNDSFASLVVSIRSGRRIYDNVHRAIRFVSAAHVPIVMLALAPLLMHGSPLLLPAQIVLLEMVIDPSCSIVFEATPAQGDVMSRPPRPLSDSPFSPAVLARGLFDGLGVGAILTAAYAGLVAAGGSGQTVGLPVFLALLACTVVLVVAGHESVSTPRNRLPWVHTLVVLAMLIAAAVAFVPGVRELMGFAEPGWSAALVPALCAGLSYAWLRWPVAASVLRRLRTANRPHPPALRPLEANPRRPIHEDPDSHRR